MAGADETAATLLGSDGLSSVLIFALPFRRCGGKNGMLDSFFSDLASGTSSASSNKPPLADATFAVVSSSSSSSASSTVALS